MNADDALTFVHVLAAFWYVSGLTAVQICLVRAWQSEDIVTKAESLVEAAHYQGILLVPGAIAAIASGPFLWAQLDYNLLTTGWLLLVELVYIIILLVCLPLTGMGLRRARMAALQARKHGGASAEMELAMADNAPLVFSGIATLVLPVIAYLSIFRPF